MNVGLTKQLDARISAAVIVFVIVVVQAIWWRGLVYRPPNKAGPHIAGGGPPRGGEALTTGREDVTVVTLAGDLEPGYADGPGREARFDGPSGIAIDAQGNLYVADTRNHRIRKIAPNGHTTTLAGGDRGYADGPAAQARFNGPCGVTVGNDGAVYVADTLNNRVRVISNGQVSTVAGGGPGYADGSGAAAKFNLPIALSWARGKTAMYVADSGNKRIRLVATTGAVSTLSNLDGMPTSVSANQGGASVQAGYLASVPYPGGLSNAAKLPQNTGSVRNEVATSMPAGQVKVNNPVALLTTKDGELAADAFHTPIFQIRNNQVEVLAGTSLPGRPVVGYRDGPGNHAMFGGSSAIVSDEKGHCFVADTVNNCIRKLTIPK